jgi:transposase
MIEQIETEDNEQDDYALLLAKLGRTFEQDQLVAFHELGHYIIDRATGTNGVSYISITPEGDYEGICRGARSEAFVKAGATGPECIDAADVRQMPAPIMPKAGESRSDKRDVYASVFDAVTQLMAGEAAEQLTLGVAQRASDDRRQAAEIAKLEAAISARVKTTPELAERAEIIESVPGLADTTSAVLIAGASELGKATDEIAAALIGLAPYDDDSGKRRGERHIKGGRRWVRNALFTPCLGAATQHNPMLKAYYERLIAKGKKPRVALVACMRKLIIILNTMIARGEKWDPSRYALR